MPREVTLDELQIWINKNKKHFWGDGANGVKFDDRTLKVKYIRFNLDTRDMKIFHISTQGFGNSEADFREEDSSETILDLLSKKLDGEK